MYAGHLDLTQPLVWTVDDALSPVDCATYIERLRSLEDIALGHRGVDKAYAIQAGREIRVMVQPSEVDDRIAAKLAYDISKQIETDLEYPGQIKVTVIRESRVSEVAK